MKPAGRLKLTTVDILRATLVAFVPFLFLDNFATGLTYSASSRHKYKHPLNIYIVELEPYVMVVPKYDRHGNLKNTSTPEYEGYIPDLIAELSRELGFKYKLVREPDNKYGHRTPQKGWDGIIGAVKNKKADVGAAPIYVTEHRLKVVDFTEPFLEVTATLLLRKPPKGQDMHIKTVRNLIEQHEIKYGTLNTGLLLYSFRNTNDSLYRMMYRKMQRFEKGVMTETNEDGINKVRTEKYAFVIPSTIGDYISKRKPCDLMTVDNFLMSRGFGLAVRKESPLLEDLNKALSSLRSAGFLDRLYSKWWNAHSECNGIKSSKVFSTNRQDSCVCNLLCILLGISSSLLLVH